MNNSKITIALVNPLHKGKLDYFPTGLCYLSSYLKKYLNGKVNIHIINQSDFSIEQIISLNPDVIGFTAFSHTLKKATQMASAIKLQKPEIPLLLGGCHISMMPESLPAEAFDYGIIGEGEITFLKLIELLIDGNFNSIANINGIYTNSSHASFNPMPLIEDLDTVPFPDRESIEEIETIIKSAHPGWFMKTRLRYAQLTTSRGCPYKCVFCQPSVMWKIFRMHSAEYIAEEIGYLHKKLGINAILVEDDLFTGSKKRIIELLDLLGKQDLLGKIIYYAAARASQIDVEWVRLLKELGVIKVELGIESGSDRIAKYLKGVKSSSEISKNAINLINKSGISVFASFIAGAPPETMEDLNLTIKLIKWIKKNHRNNSCGIGIINPLPGTRLWNYGIEKGLINANNFDWELISPKKNIPRSPSEIIYMNEYIPYNKFSKKLRHLYFRLRIGSPSEFVRAIPRRMRKLIKSIINTRS